MVVSTHAEGCHFSYDRFRNTPEEFLETVERKLATHTLMVPTQIQILLASPDLQQRDTRSLRIVVTVGAAMPLAVKELFLKMLGDRLVELYGLTEGIGTIMKPEEVRQKLTSVGTPPQVWKSGSLMMLVVKLVVKLARG